MKKKSTLVIYWKQLGDLLLLEPALAKITSRNNTDVFIATRPEFAPLFSLMTNTYIAKYRYPKAVNYVFSFDYRLRACIKSFLTKSNNKYLILAHKKYLKYWHSFFFEKISIIESSSNYRAKYFFDAIAQNSTMRFRPPQLRHPPKSWKPTCLPNKYIAIHPTSAWKNKCWSADKWASTLKALKEKGLGPFVITGGKDSWEINFTKLIVEKSNCSAINLCGQTDIQEYLSVIFNASMVLAIDGSASHIAAAFKRPVLTLFGPTDPLNWHWPTNISKIIDARNFSHKHKPTTNFIPFEVCVQEAEKLWNLVK